MYNQNLNTIGFLGESVNHSKPKKSVYLEGASIHYKGKLTQVAQAPHSYPQIALQSETYGVVYDCLKPMILLHRALGIFPISLTKLGIYKVTPSFMIYSVAVLAFFALYVAYIKWDKVEMVKSSEGRFEEAVIDYLFTVYLVPIVMTPITWYESHRVASVFTEWRVFEKVYKKMSGKKLPLFVGNKFLLVTIGLPILSCAMMVVTHVTMVHFRAVHVIPYCYINTVTYVVGGMWYLHCDVVGRVATVISNDFQQALHYIGPSVKVAEYRSLWMLLSKLIRNIGISSCYALTFLSLYLFLVITLTIYGLLSQLQDGLGVKDVGLTIIAVFAIGLLYFVCDEAHYASNCVRVNFQKKLLLVELSWMNDDAQQEINMFLRATEMNPTDMSLGGFFDVNRNLFKSLLATMVTYLVVLLQFQISIPEEHSVKGAPTTKAPH